MMQALRRLRAFKHARACPAETGGRAHRRVRLLAPTLSTTTDVCMLAGRGAMPACLGKATAHAPPRRRHLPAARAPVSRCPWSGQCASTGIRILPLVPLGAVRTETPQRRRSALRSRPQLTQTYALSVRLRSPLQLAVKALDHDQEPGFAQFWLTPRGALFRPALYSCGCLSRQRQGPVDRRRARLKSLEHMACGYLLPAESEDPLSVYDETPPICHSSVSSSSTATREVLAEPLPDISQNTCTSGSSLLSPTVSSLIGESADARGPFSTLLVSSWEAAVEEEQSRAGPLGRVPADQCVYV